MTHRSSGASRSHLLRSAALAATVLCAACTTVRPSTHGEDGADGPGERPTITVAGGAKLEKLAEPAREAGIGDPLEPSMPAVDPAVRSYLQQQGVVLLRFHQLTEGLVLGEKCDVVAAELDREGLAPAALYEAATGVPDENVATAFTNDIAEKLRHMRSCEHTGEISFTHAVVARLLGAAGL